MKTQKNRRIKLLFLSLFSFLFIQSCQQQKPFKLQQNKESVVITTSNYQLIIKKAGFRYSFKQPDGTVIAPAHLNSGIQIGEKDNSLSNINTSHLVKQSKNSLKFSAKTENGIKTSIKIWPKKHTVRMQIKPKRDGEYTILGRTKSIQPAYGLADHAAFGKGGNQKTRSKVELTGFKTNTLRGHRMISNFVVFPQQGFAEVNIYPGYKIVHLTKDENTQGSQNVRSLSSLYYFIGTPKQIYQSFLKVRNNNGYPVYKPKYDWFGVGWEAWGALGWHTNEKTITQNIKKYLSLGYLLKWMVLGSGFWPNHKINFRGRTIPAKKLQTTTSFGLWDKKLYPAPRKMIQHFHEEGLKFILGLRIGFIPGGPYTKEGLKHGYFRKGKKGSAILFEVGFPKQKVYLLNTQNKEAVKWYVKLCEKWLDYGVDGFKEDIYGYPQSLPDNMLNPVNEALMDDSVYVMGRNNYLGAAFDLARYNDFNYDQPQDRGPINGLAYAYSGFTNVYPDIVGGTGLATRKFGDAPRSKIKSYLMREAMYDALNPSMSFGYGPWNLGKRTNNICLQAAQLHDRLQPYFYSNAIKAYKTGFPYPLTPLPLVFPHDGNVYGLADTTRRSYEWMIGESLLATPLYGNDYATAKSRDVYLPKGKWMDYETGKVYKGPKTLTNFALSVNKIPLFVGGKGIVVIQKDRQLYARIYPVTNQSQIAFYDRDGKTKSRIIVDHPDWKNLSVQDLTDNQSVGVENVHHAYEFTLKPGHNYRVK
jgi:alpha-glucosidase (family GH31 glycosyl hydrolase)